MSCSWPGRRSATAGGRGFWDEMQSAPYGKIRRSARGVPGEIAPAPSRPEAGVAFLRSLARTRGSGTGRGPGGDRRTRWSWPSRPRSWPPTPASGCGRDRADPRAAPDDRPGVAKSAGRGRRPGQGGEEKLLNEPKTPAARKPSHRPMPYRLPDRGRIVARDDRLPRQAPGGRQAAG